MSVRSPRTHHDAAPPGRNSVRHLDWVRARLEASPMQRTVAIVEDGGWP
jgi:hypothetical protein